MGWLRSRWTVVALVPALFLAGFGVVSTLAGGSGDLEPGAPSSAGDEAAVTAIDTVPEGTGPTETSSDARATASGGEASPGGSGEAPSAPPPGVIDVDYGRWEGIFELANPQIVSELAVASVIGELSYLGGVDCPVGLVRVRTWFYDDSGLVVGGTVWESVQSTGEGAEVTGREPLPFEAYGQVLEVPASAALRFIAVECL